MNNFEFNSIAPKVLLGVIKKFFGIEDVFTKFSGVGYDINSKSHIFVTKDGEKYILTFQKVD